MAGELDNFDKQILNILQKDAALAAKDIAAQIGLSVSPTYERIKRLKQDGYIDKYVALVNRVKLGKHPPGTLSRYLKTAVARDLKTI